MKQRVSNLQKKSNAIFLNTCLTYKEINVRFAKTLVKLKRAIAKTKKKKEIT